jgi:hypothetical protein
MIRLLSATVLFIILTATLLSCVALLLAAERSSKWPAVRAEYLRAHPTCEACLSTGTKKNPRECHHVLPVHLFPGREVDPTNLITLCHRHHLVFGHLDNETDGYNVNVREDVARHLEKVKNRKMGGVPPFAPTLQESSTPQ